MAYVNYISFKEFERFKSAAAADDDKFTKHTVYAAHNAEHLMQMKFICPLNICKSG